MSILDLGPYMFGDVDQQIGWFQSKGLLATSKTCPVGQHQVVNHSLHFVDPASGVHTQHAESYWNRVKTKFKRMKGVHEFMLPSYLDEFMWRERHGSTASTALASLCRDIALRYPV